MFIVCLIFLPSSQRWKKTWSLSLDIGTVGKSLSHRNENVFLATIFKWTNGWGMEKWKGKSFVENCKFSDFTLLWKLNKPRLSSDSFSIPYFLQKSKHKKGWVALTWHSNVSFFNFQHVEKLSRFERKLSHTVHCAICIFYMRLNNVVQLCIFQHKFLFELFFCRVDEKFFFFFSRFVRRQTTEKQNIFYFLTQFLRARMKK